MIEKEDSDFKKWLGTLDDAVHPKNSRELALVWMAWQKAYERGIADARWKPD